MSKITNNLYLGSLSDAKNPKFINDNKIEIIIWLSDEYHNINNIFIVEDFPTEANKLFNLLPDIYDIINNNDQKNILIHCTEGVSRSPAAVIYYLIRKYKQNYQTAYNFVKKKRPIINPNFGFANILKKYEDNIYITYKLPEQKLVDLEKLMFAKML